MSVSIEIDGMEELVAKLNKIESGPWLTTGLMAAAIYLKGKIASYPRVSRRKVAQFWTAKQRRGFFYYLKHGLIDVPYKRGISSKSERLGQSWTAQARHGGREVVLGNDASYGKLVQDRDEQARYHRETGWITTQEVKAKYSKGAKDKVLAELRKMLRA